MDTDIGGSGVDIAREIHQTPDGGYIIVGETSSFGSGGVDVYLLKTNQFGEFQWSRTYGGANDDVGNSVQVASDSGYIIVGKTLSYGSPYWDLFLIRTDSLGDTLWTKTYSFYEGIAGYSVDVTAGGNFVIAATATNMNMTGAVIMKTNSSGDSLWTRYGGGIESSAYSIQVTLDNRYVVAGAILLSGPGANWDVYVLKYHLWGELAWSKLINRGNVDEGHSIRQTLDGGYIIAGTNGADVYLIKLVFDVIAVKDNRIPQAIATLKTIPNPALNWLTVEYFLSNPASIDISICDVSGRIVKNVICEKQSQGMHSRLCDVSKLAEGIYFVRMNIDKCRVAVKMLHIR